jgi:hypothetical protein
MRRHARCGVRRAACHTFPSASNAWKTLCTHEDLNFSHGSFTCASPVARLKYSPPAPCFVVSTARHSRSNILEYSAALTRLQIFFDAWGTGHTCQLRVYLRCRRGPATPPRTQRNSLHYSANPWKHKATCARANTHTDEHTPTHTPTHAHPHRHARAHTHKHARHLMRALIRQCEELPVHTPDSDFDTVYLGGLWAAACQSLARTNDDHGKWSHPHLYSTPAGGPSGPLADRGRLV